MRTLLKGEAAFHTNQRVRERTKSSSIASILLARRVRWIQTVAWNPARHQLLLSTVTGNTKLAQYQTLDEHW
eukprot:7332498-Heterocapsa_arctica.AAC.1